MLDKDGGNQRRVLKASGYNIRNPSWCPDGQRILFYREKSAHGQYRIAFEDALPDGSSRAIYLIN
jgi:Tol biopolymer transport system component